MEVKTKKILMKTNDERGVNNSENKGKASSSPKSAETRLPKHTKPVVKKGKERKGKVTTSRGEGRTKREQEGV